MSPLNSFRQQVCAAIQTDDDTWNAATIAAANAILVLYEPNVTPSQDFEELDPVRKTIGGRRAVPGARMWNATFSAVLMPAETPGDIPAIDAFFRACRFKRTVLNGTAAIGDIVPSIQNQVSLPLSSDGATDPGFYTTGTYTGGDNGVYYFTVKTSASSPSLAIDIEWVFVSSQGASQNRAGAVALDAAGSLEELVEEGISLGLVDTGIVPADVPIGTQFKFTATSADSTGVVYQTASDDDDIPAISMAFLEDGRVKRMKGCRGDMEIAATSGESVKVNFTFQGVMLDETDDGDPTVGDVALLSSVPYQDVVEEPFLAVDGTFYGQTTCFTDLSVALGNTVAMRPCAGAKTGYKSARITRGNVTGSVNPEAQKIADFDPFTRMFNGTITNSSLSFRVGRSEIRMPLTQITEIGEENRDGILVDPISFRAIEPNVADTMDDYSELFIQFDGFTS